MWRDECSFDVKMIAFIHVLSLFQCASHWTRLLRVCVEEAGAFAGNLNVLPGAAVDLSGVVASPDDCFACNVTDYCMLARPVRGCQLSSLCDAATQACVYTGDDTACVDDLACTTDTCIAATGDCAFVPNCASNTLAYTRAVCTPDGCVEEPIHERCPGASVCDTSLGCVPCITDAHCDGHFNCSVVPSCVRLECHATCSMASIARVSRFLTMPAASA